MKGISIWLFSKVVMLIFLVSVFAITTGMISIVSERAFADAAEALTIQIKDGMSGVISTGSLSAQKVIPIPDRIPEDSDSSRTYIVEVVNKNLGSDYFIYSAISWDTSGAAPKSYAASSLLYYPASLKLEGHLAQPPAPSKYLRFKSWEYRYLVVTKKTTAGFSYVCIKACNISLVSGGFDVCSTTVC